MTEHSAYHGLDLPFCGPRIAPTLSESIHEALFGDLPLSEGSPPKVPPAELGRVRDREKRQIIHFGPVEPRQPLTVLSVSLAASRLLNEEAPDCVRWPLCALGLQMIPGLHLEAHRAQAANRFGAIFQLSPNDAGCLLLFLEGSSRTCSLDFM